MKILPHRNSMLLLDEVERVGDEAHGKYTVKGTEFFLDGHFPSAPIVPGVILCEILALPVYAGLDKVKFKAPVRPGDTFETKCRITRSMGPFYFGEGEGYAGGKLCISASFSFCITDRANVVSTPGA